MSDELISTLASYVPDFIKRRLAKNPSPIISPTAQPFAAAVLFADISGFTVLTERLARRGPAGAEELTSLLNAYFGRLINLITQHNGDIVKFAGDALIALWPVSAPDTLAQVTQQATQCAVMVQQQLNAYEVAAGTRLSLKLALGAGEMLTMQLGGVQDRWEFLVAGKPLAEVGEMGHLVQPGDIVLTRCAWALVEGLAAGVPVFDDSGAENQVGVKLRQLHTPPDVEQTPAALFQPLSTKTEAGLRSYIPDAILARLAAGQRGWLAELRRVTVLFVNLPDLSYKIPVAQAQKLMVILQKAINRYEGSINKLSVDDKGVTLIAAFGLPPLAHEDDAARAVESALLIQNKLHQADYRSSIGVTTGRVFCGTVGNDQRREYTIIGDVVNLAARLMQAAKGKILCDSATCQAAQASAALELMLGVDLDGSGGVGDVPYFEKLPLLTVKGKSQPIKVFQPRDQKRMTVDPQFLATIMVGRNDESVLLGQKLQALHQSGQESVVIIEGEAGMGKSLLVGELLRQARLLGLTCLVGAGNAVDKSTPYYAWRPIFEQFFELLAVSDNPETARVHILARMEKILANVPLPIQNSPGPAAPALPDSDANAVAHAPTWGDLAPLLDAVLSLDWPENELTEQMSGKVRADNMHDLLINLLQQAVCHGCKTGHAYLIVLEDAHWLDSASWTFTRLLVEQVKPLMLIIASRPIPSPPPDEYRDLSASSSTRQIALQGLPKAEVNSLISHRLEVSDPLPESLVDLIYTKTQGNPFFTEEMTYALKDSGRIIVENGQCRIAAEDGNVQTLSLPGTIQGVITSRIDRLDPAQQLTLKVASVIGRAFEYDTLYDIHPIETTKTQLTDHLFSLDKMDITQLEKPAPNLAYIFKQTVTQEVAYNMMLFAQRRELHRAVAEWYERMFSLEDLSPFYALLAYHWQKAENGAKAVDYLEAAGEQALRDFANEEAVSFFRQALQLAEDKNGETALAVPKARRAHWEIKLGEAYVNWVKFGKAQVHLEKGLALLEYPVPKGIVQLGFGLTRQVSRQAICRWVPGVKFAKKADDSTLLEASRAYEGLTAIYYFANETVLSLYAAFRSLNLAEAAGLSPELARGFTSVGAIMGFVPVHRVAQDFCYRAINLTRKIDDLSARMWVWLGTGMYYAGVGQWSRSQNLFGQVISTANQLGDRYRWDDGVGNLAVVRYFQGQFEAGAQLAADTYHSAARRNDAHNQAWALRFQVYYLLPRGEFAQALAALEKLESLLAQDTHIIDEALRIDLHALLALVHLRLKNADAAKEAANKACGFLANVMPTSYLSLPGYAGLAETYLTLWQENGEIGKKEAQRACKSLRSYARVFPIGKARFYLWQGVFEWKLGRTQRAQKLWAKSLSAAKKMAMPYDEGLACYQIGCQLPENDPERAAYLHRAKKLFEQLDAVFDLERTREALRCTTGN